MLFMIFTSISQALVRYNPQTLTHSHHGWVKMWGKFKEKSASF